MLMVEPYNESMGQYGTSIKRESMSFSTYIDSLQSSDASQQRYLTTQYEGQNAQAALPPPCNALASDFPLAPSLMCGVTYA